MAAVHASEARAANPAPSSPCKRARGVLGRQLWARVVCASQRRYVKRHRTTTAPDLGPTPWPHGLPRPLQAQCAVGGGASMGRNGPMGGTGGTMDFDAQRRPRAARSDCRTGGERAGAGRLRTWRRARAGEQRGSDPGVWHLPCPRPTPPGGRRMAGGNGRGAWPGPGVGKRLFFFRSPRASVSTPGQRCNRRIELNLKGPPDVAVLPTNRRRSLANEGTALSRRRCSPGLRPGPAKPGGPTRVFLP